MSTPVGWQRWCFWGMSTVGCAYCQNSQKINHLHYSFRWATSLHKETTSCTETLGQKSLRIGDERRHDQTQVFDVAGFGQATQLWFGTGVVLAARLVWRISSGHVASQLPVQYWLHVGESFKRVLSMIRSHSTVSHSSKWQAGMRNLRQHKHTERNATLWVHTRLKRPCFQNSLHLPAVNVNLACQELKVVMNFSSKTENYCRRWKRDIIFRIQMGKRRRKSLTCKIVSFTDTPPDEVSRRTFSTTFWSSENRYSASGFGREFTNVMASAISWTWTVKESQWTVPEVYMLCWQKRYQVINSGGTLSLLERLNIIDMSAFKNK